MSFTFNTEHIFKKAMQRLHLIRELNSFYVGKNILDLVYQGLVESVLCYNICTWYGHLGVKNRAKLAKIVKMASKIIGREQKQLGCIYDDRVERKAPVNFKSSPQEGAIELPKQRKIFIRSHLYRMQLQY